MISVDLYKNKNVAIVGYGKTGKSIVDALLNIQVKNIYILDDNVINNKLYTSINDVDWINLDMLIVSPGIHLWWETNIAVQLARKYSIPIINDIDVFQQHVNSKIIAITGTNGKSTTTALIYHILKFNKKAVEIGGNFGKPALSLNNNADFYVLELSSYQLEACNILGFDISILLNITPDHISRHGGINGYISAKQKIFANAKSDSTAIIGIDDEYCQHILDFVNYPKVIQISGKEVPNNGVGWKDDKLIDNYFSKGSIVCGKYNILDGDHNRQNIAAAYVACRICNISKEKFVEKLFSFKNLEHRQELVRIIKGVTYINDSKATNADSTEQALKRFNNIIWILGGRPKEEGIISLVPYFSKIKKALLIGEVAEIWHNLLESYNVKNEIVYNLEKAVNFANDIAKDGDIVLLSPACASFDQFNNFEERGEKFKELVRKL